MGMLPMFPILLLLPIIIAAAARTNALNAVLEQFRVAGATAADRAQTLEVLGVTDRRVTDRLLATGALKRDATSGRVYLDERAVAEHRRRDDGRRKPMLVAVGLILILGGAAAFFMAAHAIRPR